MTIEEICAKAQSLPASPSILPRLLDLLGREDASMEDLEGIIQTDTGISAAVLRMANSAYMGASNKCADISEAILRLGFSRTHELVVTVAGGRWNSIDLAGYSWQPGDFFRHSFAVAVAASNIAKRMKIESPEVVYVAGLMHESGKLALAYANPESIERIREFQQAQQCEWLEAERAVLGFAHTDISKRMMEDWSFPEVLIQVAFHYPLPMEAPEKFRRLIGIVHLAKHLAIQTGIGAGEDAFWLNAQDEVLVSIGLTDEDIEAVLAATITRVRALLKDSMLSGVIKI